MVSKGHRDSAKNKNFNMIKPMNVQNETSNNNSKSDRISSNAKNVMDLLKRLNSEPYDSKSGGATAIKSVSNQGQFRFDNVNKSNKLKS